MKQFLNIQDMNGGNIPPVDCITFGSPCQGLSVAGARKGLEDERSNLFYEAIRIIEEMRKETHGEYPRYAVWENVKGAFSSAKGDDFRAVLDTIVKLAVQEAPSLSVPKNGWPPAGNIMGDRWSIAWRTFDAQYWGVPQRRKRILLVADLTGQSAPEILFKQNSLPGDFATLPKSWEGIATNTGTCLVTADTGSRGNGNGAGSGTGNDDTDPSQCHTGTSLTFSDVASTLRAEAGAPKHNADMVGRLVGDETVEETYCLQGSMIGRADKNGPQGDGINEDVSFTLNTIDHHAVCCNEGGQEVFENHRADCRYTGPLETAPTICSRYGTGGDNVPYVMAEESPYALSVETHHDGSVRVGNVIPTLGARDYKGGKNVCCSLEPESKVYTLDRESFNSGANYERTPVIEENGVCSTVISRGPSAVGAPTTEDGKRYRVRRLTPTECARLQGFPDWWHDLTTIEDMSDHDYTFWKTVLEGIASIEGKTYKEKTKKQMITWYNKLASDSSKYKMWGNGVALPMVRVPMRGIANHGAVTMGSLFDGSGGFPLAGLLEGMKPLWSSEVQPYPLAVTKERFQEVGVNV